MKKIGLILLTTFLLGGCQKAVANVPSEVLATYKQQSVNARDMFDIARVNNNVYTLAMRNAIMLIGNKEIPEDDLNAEVSKTIQSYHDSYGDDFINQLSNAGYYSTDDFIERALKPQAYKKLLKDKYAKDQRQTILDQYQFKKVRILEFGNEADAQSAINTLELETATWEEIEKENNARDLGLVYKGVSTDQNARVPKEVETAVLATKEKGLIPKVVASAGKFYVVDIVETDPEALKSEIDIKLETLSELNNQSLKYYFKEHKLRFYDQNLFDSFNEEYNK